MRSGAATVEQYMEGLPADRRQSIELVRQVVLKNLDSDYEEGMQYGMIGYYVPHRVYPKGYHCDPKQPLPLAGLASQKNHMSLYLMSLYEGGVENALATWFREAWAKTGRKLDMGKCCIRFRKAEDLALDVIGEAIRKLPAKEYVARCERMLGAPREGSGAKGRSSGGAAGRKARVARRAKKTARPVAAPRAAKSARGPQRAKPRRGSRGGK